MLVDTYCFILSAIGRTTLRLADRIKQHVPTSIRTKNNITREQPPRMYKNSKSKIGALESVYIKTQSPVLCKQKESVFSLGLFK